MHRIQSSTVMEVHIIYSHIIRFFVGVFPKENYFSKKELSNLVRKALLDFSFTIYKSAFHTYCILLYFVDHFLCGSSQNGGCAYSKSFVTHSFRTSVV